MQKQAGFWLLPAFFAFILLMLIFLYVKTAPSYRLQIVSEDRLIYDVPAEADTVMVTFRHSVNKGLIREVYHLDLKQGKIALQTGYFENYGAGMLDTVPEDIGFRQEDNFLILDFPLKYQDSFTYRAGPEAQHQLYYGQDALPLYETISMKSFKIFLIQD
jgi:hypothetical protein